MAAAAIVALALLLGVGKPNLSLMGGLHALLMEDAPPITASTDGLLAVVVVQDLVFSVALVPLRRSEEFGWRGYLQLRLSPTGSSWPPLAQG